MRLYSVHLRPGDPATDAVLVKEGFSWPALFWGPVWALTRNLWVAAAGWLAVASLIAALAQEWSNYAGILAALGVGLAVLFAAEANEFRRVSLARRGWREAGVVGGADKDAAARRYSDLAALGRT